MRFDILSVFPEFFSVLDVSLVGKAQAHGVLTITTHDLRDWTDDPHRSVDDTPVGGGAGMVMRADVWGRALDDVLRSPLPSGEPSSGETVLAIPTPAGIPLTQRACEDLASSAARIVIACGRYEGIDARVVEYYAAHNVRTFEYSLGDYVLNGGEIAAVALVEAVGRLLPGVVGNPESLVEESHGAAGLLEYPVFTRPIEWRGYRVPDVLLSGNHREVARWRRYRAYERTAQRRPDMLERIDTVALTKRDKRKLAELGYLVPQGAAHPLRMDVREARLDDVAELAALAARTFPDAAPPHLTAQSVDMFIEEFLSASCIAHYIEADEWLVMVLSDRCGHLAGYSLCLIPAGDGVAGSDDGAPAAAVVGGRARRGPLIELSKFYVDRDYRGIGAAAYLFEGTRTALLHRSAQYEEPYLWLGTNHENTRARHAYRKLGFSEVGTRVFRVGDQDNSDVVYAMPLRVA